MNENTPTEPTDPTDPATFADLLDARPALLDALRRWLRERDQPEGSARLAKAVASLNEQAVRSGLKW